jgi:hypothetical protein
LWLANHHTFRSVNSIFLNEDTEYFSVWSFSALFDSSSRHYACCYNIFSHFSEKMTLIFHC